MKTLTAACAVLMLATAAHAEAPVTQTTEGSFDDVAAAVESAIINAGLVIDGTHQVGDMLARTKADVGGTKDLFTHATTFTFCSATASRQVMEADIANLQHCPYAVFVYETPDAPGKITVGHRAYADPAMAPVTELLDGIVADALN